MSYILAIDGGGSKTNAILANESGEILGEGSSGATSLTATSVGAAGFSLREAARQAVSRDRPVKIDICVMGLAGMDTQEEHDDAYQTFFSILKQFRVEKFVLLNDIEIALAGGTDKENAIALISGTGSNCYGKNYKGEIAKVGGMDFLLTDQGSGFAIGRRVLREAVKSYDGRSPKSILEKLVCEYFKIQSVNQLKTKVYNPLLSKTDTADLAKLCFSAQAEGDGVAEQILVDAILQLTIMVEAVIRRLNLKNIDTDLVLVGSIFKNDWFREKFLSEMSNNFSQLNCVFPDKEPVYGALKLALNSK